MSNYFRQSHNHDSIFGCAVLVLLIAASLLWGFAIYDGIMIFGLKP